MPDQVEAATADRAGRGVYG